ncbi:MAG: hypothetical protein WKG07_15360 [Hymenobacter sp.]
MMPTNAPRRKNRRYPCPGGRRRAVRPGPRGARGRGRPPAGQGPPRRRVLVPPFDDAYVIAGQGTAGLEMSRRPARRGPGAGPRGRRRPAGGSAAPSSC